MFNANTVLEAELLNTYKFSRGEAYLFEEVSFYVLNFNLNVKKSLNFDIYEIT